MLFAQSSAPTGWSKSTSHNNKALRVVSGSGGGSGGSQAFTSAFANRSVSVSGSGTASISISVSGSTGNTGNPTTTQYLNVVTDQHASVSADLPSHRHYTGKNVGSFGSGYGLVDSMTATSSGAFYTNYEGSNGSHHHAIYLHPLGNHTHSGASFSGSGSDSDTVSVSSSGSLNMSVQYVDVIICTKS